MLRSLLGLVLTAVALDFAAAADLAVVKKLAVEGDATEPTQSSGVARIAGFTAICPDETAKLNLFQLSGDELRWHSSPVLGDEEPDSELDLEGLATDGSVLYVLGSHALNREKPKGGNTQKANVERFTEVDDSNKRDRLYRLEFDGSGAIVEADRMRPNLRKVLLEGESFLAPFCSVPSKENGLDLEGIAWFDEKLFLGCRGPVLLGGYVPVIVTDFDAPEEHKVRFVPLGGRGIRDLTAVGDGLLIVGGPVGDEDGEYFLYYWDGKNCMQGTDAPARKPKLLGRIPAEAGAKAEGITLLRETSDAYEVLIVFDGPSGGDPTVFRAPK